MVSVVIPVAGDGLILPNSSNERVPGLEKDLNSLEILGKARRVGLAGGRAHRLLRAGAIVAALWDKELAIRPTFLSRHPHHHIDQLHAATQSSPKKAFDGTTGGWTASWGSNH